MANNPIFPFYVNDFEGGTRHMTDAEVGCYLRLLMAQFNRGGQLPADEKILTRYCTSFPESWPIVKEKFKNVNGSKIQNKRLELERLKRESFVESRSKNKLGKTKSHENHMKNTSETSEDHLGKGKGKGNGSGLGNGHVEGGLEGDVADQKYIVPQMCELWYTNFPVYTKDKDKDQDGMGKVLQFIHKQSPESKNTGDPVTQEKILNTLQLIADQVNRTPFWVNRPIKSIANNIQLFYNDIKNPMQDGKQGFANGKPAQDQFRTGVQADRDARREKRKQGGY